MGKKPNIWITLLMATMLVGSLSFVLPKNADKYLSELFWSRKTFAHAKYNVVILGDSRVYRGLSPEIIESYLPNMEVLNFAFSNGGLNQTMFKAGESKLGNHDKPKVIIIGISANTVTGYSAPNTQYLQEMNRPREELMERMYFNPVLYWFSPTSPKKLKQHFSDEKETAYYRHNYFMNGYVESDKFPMDTLEAIPSYTRDFNSFKVEQDYLNILFNQVKTWSDSGIIVVGFTPPISQPMRALEDSLGLYNQKAIQSGFEKASGHWIEINPNEFKTYDGSHLVIESAQNLSHIVGEEIVEIIENNMAK